jgi:hypothetical protein
MAEQQRRIVWVCPDCDRVAETQGRWKAGDREWGPFCRHGNYDLHAPSTQAVAVEMVLAPGPGRG